MTDEILEEARLALKISKGMFTSVEINYEKVVIFAKLIENQSKKIGIGWQELLKQYEELSFEIYSRKFKSNNIDLFAQVRKAIESGSYGMFKVS